MKIATDSLSARRDSFGEPYLEHSMRVMKAGRNLNEKIVGILHDVERHTDWTFGEIQAHGFSAEIMTALICLSWNSKREAYEDYITRLSVNPLAVAVKVHELADHMDLTKFPPIGDREIALIRNYQSAYLKLKPLYKPVRKTMEEARRLFPNAFRPWTTEMDDKLERLFCEKYTVKDIAKQFGRSRGSIEARILHLELPDKYGVEFEASEKAKWFARTK